MANAVKIETDRESTIHKLTRWLVILLGVMVASMILISSGNPSITGAAVFNRIYGGASPFVILFVLVVVIYLYTKLR